MKTYFVSKRRYFFIAAFAFIAFSGCDSTSNEDEAPDVIPSEVFALPVDLFNQTGGKTAQPGINFTAAALRVWPVSLIISANLIIPSITTLQAIEAEPVFQDGAWQWTSTTTVNAQTVEFVLSAERSGDATNWNMKITSSDAMGNLILEDYELFSAETTQNGDTGSWQLYYMLDNVSQNVLNASYVRESDTEKTITFSIPETASLNAGDSVEYSEDGTARSFIWQQVAEGITHSVFWDATTLEGSITATNFNGRAIGCWDANLDDAACPSS